MGAGEAAEGHRVQALTREAGITHAVEVLQSRAVEGHRQQARQAQGRDRAVAAAHASQEAAVGAGGADLLVADRTAQAREDGLEALHQAGGISGLLRLVGAGAEGRPGRDVARGEGVDDVAPLWGEGGIQQGRDRDEDHPLLVLHRRPVLQQQVVAVEALRDHRGLHPQVQREEGWGGLVAAAPGRFGLGGVGCIHERLAHRTLARKGVPAGRVAHHAAGVDRFAIRELHAGGLAVLDQHLGDAGLVADLAAVALEARHQFLGDHPNASLGVVDAAGMAIREDHPGVDHRREVRRHHAPAEALHVDQLQQLLVLDVFAGHIADVEGQPAGQPQAGQGRLEEDLGQVGRVLERQQRHRIEAVEHLPAGVIEGADALGFVGEESRQAGDEGFVVPVDGHVQAAGQVVFELGGIRHRLAVLAHIAQGPGEQVRVALLPEAKDHRGAHVKRVALAAEAAPRSPRDQVALQHQGLGPLGSQLGGGDQAADARADHDHVPGGLGHGGGGGSSLDPRRRPGFARRRGPGRSGPGPGRRHSGGACRGCAREAPAIGRSWGASAGTSRWGPRR